MEITDKERTVIRVSFDDGDFYLNSGNFQLKSNPWEATRYAPHDDAYPKRKEGQDKDVEWMEDSYDNEVSVVPFLEACDTYNKKHDEQ